MTDRHDYVALEWVKGEIETTLSLARQALESYVEDAQDATQLGFCFNYLHQVNGTLQMVEFYGAALLSEELEKLAQKLVDQNVKATEENLSILMQGILQLPNYLDKVKEYQQDLPIVLLPIINEIRTACHEEMMSAGVLFQPDLTESKKAFPPISDAYEQTQLNINLQFLGLVKKLRQMYQVALLGLLKNQDLEKNLAYLEKVMTHLNKHCANTPVSVYWNASQALIAGLQDGSIELNASTKEILKDVDQSIKSVIEAPKKALAVYVNEDQLKNLLFYIAKAQSQNTNIQAVKKLFKLDDALPNIEGYTSENAMAGPDKDAMHSVDEETAKIKEQIEVLTNQGATKEDLVETKNAVKLIGDTMAALGLTDLRKVLLEQFKVLDLADQNDQALNESQLMEMASSILFVESSLSGEASHADGAPMSMHEGVSDAHNAVIREARNGLEQTKDAIVEYIGSQWDIEKIADIPQTLKAIGGGLRMIPLQKASNILEACEKYFSQKLIEEKHVPQWNELDQLADSLMGIEYFLERLTQDGRGSNASLLNTAQERIEALGMRVASCDEVEEEQTVQSAVVEEPEIESAEIESLVPPISVTQESPKAEVVNTTEDDDDIIDDEILEIFVEEVGEVLEAIHEYVPKYKENSEDKESLTEFRRAFHTLKGSGRMVGANDLGELAWSIESMLNKHIEGLVDYSDSLFQVIEDVAQYVPTLISQFEKREPVDLEKIAKLTQRANAIAAGEIQDSTANEESLELVEESVEPTLEETPVLDIQETEETVELSLEEPTLEAEINDIEIEESSESIEFELEEFSTDEPELTLLEEDSLEVTELTMLEEESVEEPELLIVEEDELDVPELTMLEEDSIEIPELSIVEEDELDIPELTMLEESVEEPELSIVEEDECLRLASLLK